MSVLDANLIAFALTSLAIELTPGPNMAFLAVLGLSRGRAAGFAAVAGVALGLAILGAAVGLGIGSFILDNRYAYESVRWIGAAYMLWLAWDAFRDGCRPVDTGQMDMAVRTYFQRGLVTNLLNPKAALFFVTVMPDFTREGAGLEGLATLIAIYVAVATLIHAVIVLLASTLEPILTRPRWRQTTGNIFAVLLVAIAIWLFLSSQR